MSPVVLISAPDLSPRNDMLPRKTPRRKCRDHEREWKGFCVDRNLEDDWLERLNRLEALSLISICEGHCDRRTEPSGKSPHIKLRLKEHLLPGLAGHWDDQKMTVVSEVNRLFQTGDTYVNLELKFKLRSGTGRLNYQEDLIVRVHSRQARPSEEMDAETCDWLQHSVSRIEELDDLLARLWSGAHPSA
jgi:hypothetical protein